MMPFTSGGLIKKKKEEFCSVKLKCETLLAFPEIHVVLLRLFLWTLCEICYFMSLHSPNSTDVPTDNKIKKILKSCCCYVVYFLMKLLIVPIILSEYQIIYVIFIPLMSIRYKIGIFFSATSHQS